MAHNSGAVVCECRYCGRRYWRTNFMKRKSLWGAADDQGRLLEDTHQAACWRKLKAMTKSVKETPMKTEKCPKCGEPYDPAVDQVIECPRCGVEGSTACCNVGGNNCPCVACEEGEDE